MKLELCSCMKIEGQDTFALVLFSVSADMIEIKSFCNFWNPDVFKSWVQLLHSHPLGFFCLGLGLDFGAVVWPQVGQLCRKSFVRKSQAKLGLPHVAFDLCLAGLLVPCLGQAVPQCHLSAMDLCGGLNSWLKSSADNRFDLLNLHRWRNCGYWAWQSCHYPCLPCHQPPLLDHLTVWNSLPLLHLGSSLLCPQLLDSWGLSLYLDCVLEESSFKSLWFFSS